MRKIFFFIAVLSLIFISPVAFSQEATTTDQGSDQTQVINQEPTQTVKTEEVEEETEPEEVCAGLKDFDFRRCIIKEKGDRRLKHLRAIRGRVPEIKGKFEEVSEKLVEEHMKELKEGIKEHLIRGQNIFVIGPAGRALAAGEIQSVSTNTLSVNTLGFLSQWDISNAKIVKVPGGEGKVSDLEAGRRVRVIGRWDSENHILVAKVVIVKSSVEIMPPVIKPPVKVKPPEKTPTLPAPVPVLLQQILKALQERGIQINLPQR